jgi:uncharacterized protein YndB with AHSA1/START domain
MIRPTSPPPHAHFTIERAYARVTLDDVWELWTTAAGIEAWWGPEGFDVSVAALDPTPGGELVYVMTAVAPEQAAFMRQAGMPLSTECRVRYTELSPIHRLAYATVADFIPGVAPYEVATVLDLQATAKGVAITMTFDAMHDDVWTQRARAGHESQMRKLDQLMMARSSEVWP